MAKFKNNNNKQWLQSFWVVIFGIVLAIAAVILPFFIYPSTDESINWARTRVFLSMITIPIILFGFYFTTIQLRKYIAKPKLEVIFSKTNSNEITINILPKEADKQYLKISVINKGNAITDMFQISFYIPKIYNPTINYVNEGNENAYDTRHYGDTDIVSFKNNHKYICFVDTPTRFPSLVLNTYQKEYSNITNELAIPYKIYGDWKEAQEGELKVIINKQEEATHARS